MQLDDPYAAYCLDEACLYMVQMALDGKEPNFNRPAKRKHTSTNGASIDALKRLGAKMI